jgi:8-oxo-dGTP diphosphatase
MLTDTRPVDFNPKVEVVGCFCEFDGEFLLLKREENDPHDSKWALPGGKVDKGETLEQAILREVLEETGIDILGRVKFFKTMYERYPDGDYVYHIFHAKLNDNQSVTLSSEHSAYVSTSPKKALEMDIIEDLDVCINMVYLLESGK